MAKSVSAKGDGLLYTRRWRSLRWDTEQFIHCKRKSAEYRYRYRIRGGRSTDGRLLFRNIEVSTRRCYCEI